jgi:hypothetical protein
MIALGAVITTKSLRFWRSLSLPIFVDKRGALCSNEGVEGNLKPGDLVRWKADKNWNLGMMPRRGSLDIVTGVYHSGCYVTVLSCGSRKLYSTRFRKIEPTE